MNDIYFIYDGECPICNYAAHAFRIREAVGVLHLINAREDQNNPLIAKINKRNLDLDEGMVILYKDTFYHGQEALHLMGLISTDSGWFNKINAFLFKSKATAKLSYPAMRGMRNLLIKIKGVSKIDNLDKKNVPIFKTVFGKDWERLPLVMQKHYANRPYQNETTVAEGALKVESSFIGRLFAPLFRLTGTLVPYEGDNVPTTVRFVTTIGSDEFQFDRLFHFPGERPYRFHSHMKPIGGNELIEFMRFGLGWHMAYSYDGQKVILSHKGCVWKIFGLSLPVPMAFFLGKGYAEEIPVDDDTFSMMTEIRHPLWGKVYGYSGTFKIIKEA